MKYRDPKTGEVFDDIADARFHHCEGQVCNRCKLCSSHQSYDLECGAYCEAYPTEAARLMGLEVMEGLKSEGTP